MQDNYDPHKDIDSLRKDLWSDKRACRLLDRVRNWIDEAAWNTDQKFTDDPLKPRVEDFMPLGAQGKAVNRTYEDARKEADGRLKHGTNIIELHKLLDAKDNLLTAYEKRIENVKKMLAVQADTGNKDASPHMYGMYVALELALATLEDRNTNWEDYKGVSEYTAIDRQMNDVRNKNTELEGHNIELKETIAHMQQDLKLGHIVNDSNKRSIDEAYQRGLREGKIEAREEWLHGGVRPFTSD